MSCQRRKFTCVGREKILIQLISFESFWTVDTYLLNFIMITFRKLEIICPSIKWIQDVFIKIVKKDQNQIKWI